MSAPHHIVSPKMYLLIFFALMIGTALTVYVARVDLGPWNIYVALSIAVAKTTLVVLYFMHMKYSERLNWVYAGAGVVWLIILITLTLSDYFTRTWK